ncbi:MAG TPA: alpha/beta hydrolase [Bacillales bacterium]|nr:alpha/beta hydrolase [Bacillales bacterium]
MEAVTFTFQTVDGAEIYVHKWIPSGKVIGVVQIAHGMSEHSARYEAFASVLVDEGYAVYANDHRGHGETAGGKENLGYFADENGWELVVDDLYEVTNIAKEGHSGLPVFLFGHSMGSFLSRRYVQKYGRELAGVILSGTGADQGVLSSVAIGMAKREIRKHGKKARSELLTRLSFGSYNKAFEPWRTEFDWLTRDEKEVDRYIKDPYCGAVATAGFYYDLFVGLKRLDKPALLKQMPKNLPVFFVSGDQDPVGQNTKGVLKVARHLQKAGIRDIDVKFYKDGRHELLNELNKEEVYQDIIRWLRTKIEAIVQ